MTDGLRRVAIDGVGLVGGRLARELVSGHRGLEVALYSSRAERREELRGVFRDAIRAATVTVHGPSRAVPGGVELVVLTGDQRGQVVAAQEHVRAGRSVVTTVDSHEHARGLLALDGMVRDNGVTLVVGACFSPGLSDILAAYGATRMDSVLELHFARHGVGGPQCAADLQAATRRDAHEWHDGRWVTHPRGSGRELCWFPDPIGGRDAYFADTAEPLIAVEAMADLVRCSARIVLSRAERLAQCLPRPVQPRTVDSIGAVRVELRGTHGAQHVTRVFGALDRPGVAAGAVACEVVMAVLGGEAPIGVIGAGSVTDPVVMLKRLRARGVRVAELLDSLAPDALPGGVGH